MAFGSSSSPSMLHKNEEENENHDQDIHPKKRRNPRIPCPDTEIIALSPATLMAKNRFVCEVCFKGFPREQNLQLHKRGHNLPWNLKQSTRKDVKRKAYICPESSCIHHNPSHSLGDLTGIKKHYFRKHGEKKYKCQKCDKLYAVESDLKAHTKTCGNKEYQCHCGTLFSRRDSFISHRAFCETLIDRGLFSHPPTTINSMRLCSPKSPHMTLTSPSIVPSTTHTNNMITPSNCYKPSQAFLVPSFDQCKHQGTLETTNFTHYGSGEGSSLFSGGLNLSHNAATMVPQLSATALLQKASLLGSTWSNSNSDNSFAQEYAACDYGNMHESNVPNYFSTSDVRSSMLNLNSGVNEQEGSYHGGGGGEWSTDQQQLLQPLGDMGFRQSGGAMFTRDFLGVGGGVNISSDGPESTFVGRSFL